MTVCAHNWLEVDISCDCPEHEKEDWFWNHPAIWCEKCDDLRDLAYEDDPREV